MSTHSNDAPNSGTQEQNGTETTDGVPAAEQSQQDGGAPDVYQLKVELPQSPHFMDIHASTLEQVQDIRQSIIETPDTFQYTCFHLEHKGQRVNDFVELREVPGISADSVLKLKEDPYTEKEARMHVIRIRELIGAAGDRTDLIQGLSAGMSQYDDVTETANRTLDLNSQDQATHSRAAGAKLAQLKELGEYSFGAPGSVQAIALSTPESAPKTIKSLSLSRWHPPPARFRTQGHLLYLQFVPIEGNNIEVTSHVKGFYVNKSDNNRFDPQPKQGGKFAHSLYNLIYELSPEFKHSFAKLQAVNSKRESLSLFQLSNAIPASPWLISESAYAAHQADITRTQESWLMSGVDAADTLRDWNEEFQSTRELPREAVQDRVFRERLTSKLFADYNEAATRGAVLVARGEIPPLNPTEGKDAQIFVYNNVFFSFGADGVGTFSTEGGDEAARVATGKDVIGVKAVNNLDIKGLFTPGTVVVDYLGKRIVGQSIVPGIFKQREDGEYQIEYGGVEGKDIVAEHDEFVESFKKMSEAFKVKKHTVWDKEKKAHTLEASVETKGLTGTDGRKYVLDLYRITPLDVNWLEKYWTARPTDEKATRESAQDGKTPYPHRMAVLRKELIESYERMKLREYIHNQTSQSGDQKATEMETDMNGDSNTAEDKETTDKSKEEQNSTNGDVVATATNGEVEPSEHANGEPESKGVTPIDFENFKFSLNPDVYSHQDPQTEEERKRYEEDMEEVRQICRWLTKSINGTPGVIPQLLSELEDGEVGFPMDGQSLSTLLHKRGINVRYLGHVATECDKQHESQKKKTQRIPALKRLVIQEMISRAFKHVVNSKLRHLPPVFAPACVAHLLNCYLGRSLNTSPSPATRTDEELKSLKEIYIGTDFSFENINPNGLWDQIVEQVSMRYRYSLDEQDISPQNGKSLQMLREASLKLGLQLVAKDYVFDKSHHANGAAVPAASAAPGANGHTNGNIKKKKNKGQATQQRAPSPAPSTTTFVPDDVLNVVPVIKEASPKSSLAEEAYEGGRMTVNAKDGKDLGQELLLESLSLYEQIYGILHPEVARAYLNLSTMYYTTGEKSVAVELARKAVIVSERTLGVDASETVLSYLNLGLFEHGIGNSMGAITYILHALDLWRLIYGPGHPDSITTINNIAVMLQSQKCYRESRYWFEAAMDISKNISGDESVGSATILFQLAHAVALEGGDGSAKDAMVKMRQAHKIFSQELGDTSQNTIEAGNFLSTLTAKAVSDAKRVQGAATGRMSQVRLQNATPTMRGGGTTLTQEDKRKVEDLLKYIEEPTSGKKAPKKESANPLKKRGKAK